MSEQLWTSFNDKKFAAERAKYDWNGNLITSPNDGTLSITVGSGNAQTFTANQATNTTTTVTVPLASIDTSGATPVYTEGLMTVAMVQKLDEVSIVQESQINGNIILDGTETDVYTHPNDGPGAVSAGDTTNQTPGFGDTFKVTSETVNAAGHTTTLAEHTVTIPNATAVAPTQQDPTGSAGLMSAADKDKLDNIEAGAQVNVKPDWNAASGTDAEILNKPNIPTVNDATLTITVAGTASTFTANSSTPTSVSIPNAASASSGVSATGGLMTASDKENLDTLADATPTGTDAPSSSNSLVTESMLETAVGSIGAFQVTTLTGTSPNEYPAEANPSTKVIYLTKDTSSSATDPYTEWIYTGTPGQTVDPSKWEIIGETSIDLSGYKTKQTAVLDPSTSGNTSDFQFISSISQNANGEITPAKHTIPTMTGASSGSAGASGLVPTPGSNDDVNFLKGDGTWSAVPTMTGANGTNAGTAGLVPAPTATDNTKFLKGDGTWATVSTADEKVKQTAKSDSVEYLLLASTETASSITSGNDYGAIYASGITVNPSTSTITATNFAGNATTATTATDYNTTSGTIKTALDGKPNKPSSSTSGHIATFDANGDLADGGYDLSHYKTVQTAVSDPTASGNATSFIDSISQDTNGEITVTKKTVPTVSPTTSHASGTGTDGIMTGDQAETLANLNHWKYDTFDSSGPSGTETAVNY